MHFIKFLPALLLSLLVLPAQAALLTQTNDYVVAQDQVVESEQWIVANSAQAKGTFKNDLFISTVADLDLSGTMEGNVWGSSYTEADFSGTGRRNVRLFAQTVRIEGAIDGNLMVSALSISVATNATIAGDVRLQGIQIVMEGAVGGNLDMTSFQTATISGRIAGNATLSAPELILTDDARITGNLNYTTGKELIPDAQVVSGSLMRTAPASPYSTERIEIHILFFLGALLTGVVFISLFPMTTAMASLLARKAPLKCLWVGFLALVLLLLFATISINSIIGLPLGLVTFASWGILVYTSRIIIGLMLGTLVLKAANNSAGRVLLSMVTGLAIIYLFTFIPNGIGRMIQFFVACTGVGSLLLALLQKRRLIIKVPEELKQLEALKHQSKQQEES